MIYLDDLTPSTKKKTKLHTLAFDETDDQLIREVRTLLGRSNTAEIMRRAIRIGMSQAIEKFQPKGR